MLNICLCSNLPRHSITVTVGESFVTISLPGLSFPAFSLVDLVLLEDWEERGEHSHSVSSRRFRRANVQRVPRSFHSGFYTADRQTHLSLMVESAACLIPGNIAVRDMDGLVFVFRAIGIVEPYREVYHRIIEWFGLKGTLKIICFQPPCHEQGHLPLDRLLKAPSNLALIRRSPQTNI